MINIASRMLDNFVWSNKYDWTGVVQQKTRTLTGAMIIEPTKTAVGRPITLTSHLEKNAIFQTLKNHSMTETGQFTIDINGTQYSVVWLHENIAFSGKPISNYSDQEPDFFSDISLKLMTV